ncbi:ABC transporter ATP-binding protein [Actinoplanes cyaneus]|uniref:ABC transporter ATP-binding protein n=1 Tax=Actinoplanes cyaneus TaxID=52696 RepID=A0A919IGQ8_9ACTN|nr:ATP-binding cassette domain-containing protein [Actinoplanes cyaneus]MCW2136796.1 ATPase components of ABC transporters with duplicated ATPase domains [Actinoplanes cyaneus]GID64052.1 ABC transporter ATP-binding protein [Actinoplanes cyaneus]
MGYVDVAGVGFVLPDGRELFTDVSFRVGEGAKVALVGPNGAGKTTLLRTVAGDIPTQSGTVARSGGVGVMRQFIGMIGDDRTLEDMALSLVAPPLREAGDRLAKATQALDETEKSQIAYANALAHWGEAGGYDAEVLFDTVAVSILGKPWDEARSRVVRTLSGGEQKRFALDLLLRGSDEVLLLDEPDNFLDVPAKRWLEQRIRESNKSILYISHDRELLAQTADRVVAVEGGGAWTHPGGFASWHEARANRHERMEELRRRWDEEHEKLRELVFTLKNKAAYNDGLASRYQAAQTRLRKFEEAGPPPLPPKEQAVRMNLRGGRTGKRSVICESLELEDLTFPFDLEIWYGDRVAVLGANGTGKSHFLRLLAAGGSEPDVEHQPVDGAPLAQVKHNGVARLGARVRPGHFSQTHDRPELMEKTLVEILWRGDEHRSGMDRAGSMKHLSRYELSAQGDQRFGTLSGGQQARFLVLLLELSGATLLLLDEPTDNLDLASAEALEEGLKAFDGTVIAVTHDRWFTRSFDRFVLFRSDNEVVEVPEPVWDVR